MTVWTRPEAAAYRADRVFEHLVGEKLRGLGWTCEVLETADHLGADLICTHRDDKAIVQCAPGARIDISDLQRGAALKAYHGAGMAMIVHNGTPAAELQRLADEMGVALVHTDALVVAGAYDRSDYGVRLRLDRELVLEQERKSRQETANRLALMAHYEAINRHEQELKAWRTARRRRPWVRGMALASIAPPFLLLGTPYFIFFLLAAVGVVFGALYFTRTGPEPSPPAPLTDLTPGDVIPERAAAAFVPRPTLKERTQGGGVPAPAGLTRAHRQRPAPLDEPKSIVKCPKCHTRMRLPRGKRLWANCPKCKNRFRADT